MSDVTEGAARDDVRMEPLATLPVFFKLNGKRAMMAGGGVAAAWKAELLAAAGANVEVFATAFCGNFDRLGASPSAGSVTLIPREWAPDDLRGATIAIGAIDDDQEAMAFCRAARQHGVPVNVVDKSAFCDFQFGTIVARSPLVIGISTDGGAPVFGQAIRARIESLLPQSFAAWAQAAKDWRPAVQAKDLDFRTRRRFWEVFADRALRAGERRPSADDQAQCFEAALNQRQATLGAVSLVGCGPGTVDGTTFGAARVLQSADLVVYDADVPAAIIGLARRESTKTPTTGNDAVVEMLRAKAAEGLHVVWLGTGDPLTCARWQVRTRALADVGCLAKLTGGVSACPRCTQHCEAPRSPG